MEAAQVIKTAQALRPESSRANYHGNPPALARLVGTVKTHPVLGGLYAYGDLQEEKVAGSFRTLDRMECGPDAPLGADELLPRHSAEGVPRAATPREVANILNGVNPRIPLADAGETAKTDTLEGLLALLGASIVDPGLMNRIGYESTRHFTAALFRGEPLPTLLGIKGTATAFRHLEGLFYNGSAGTNHRLLALVAFNNFLFRNGLANDQNARPLELERCQFGKVVCDGQKIDEFLGRHVTLEAKTGNVVGPDALPGKTMPEFTQDDFVRWGKGRGLVSQRGGFTLWDLRASHAFLDAHGKKPWYAKFLKRGRSDPFEERLRNLTGFTFTQE